MRTPEVLPLSRIRFILHNPDLSEALRALLYANLGVVST